jgi:hypothetical protein
MIPVGKIQHLLQQHNLLQHRQQKQHQQKMQAAHKTFSQ